MRMWLRQKRSAALDMKNIMHFNVPLNVVQNVVLIITVPVYRQNIVNATKDTVWITFPKHVYLCVQKDVQMDDVSRQASASAILVMLTWNNLRADCVNLFVSIAVTVSA